MDSRLSIDYYFFSLIALVCNLFRALYATLSGAIGSLWRDEEAHKNGRRGGRSRRVSMDQSCDKGGSAYDEAAGDYGAYSNSRVHISNRYSPRRYHEPAGSSNNLRQRGNREHDRRYYNK